MAKKKAKPDFSKPKELKAKEQDSLQEAPDFLPTSNFNTTEAPDFLPEETQTELPPQDLEASEDYEYSGLPLVVIAGRPNVGKSTLFNKFLHKRVAITNDQPGVTRDPVEATAILNGKPVWLVDTGGYKLTRDIGTKEAELDDYVVERSLEMIDKADVVILLLEAGVITGEDEEFILKMRPYWNKLIAAVNKTEGGKNEAEAWNYAKYGFDELIFISAEHGDRIGELTNLITSRCDFSNVKLISTERPIKIAILGKPNTGKSTLSNRLTHTENSIVCDYAGTTRDVVEGDFEYAGKKFHVLDTAGIRRKARVHEDVEYYSVNRAIKTLDECDIVFLLIDAVEGLAEQDKKICSLAFEKGRGIIFVMNKWDLREEQDRKAVKSVREWMNIMFGQMDFAPIMPLSALEGTGIKDLLNTALNMYSQLTMKIDTASLNNALQDWLDRYPPPASKTSHFKIRYMTQTGTNPVKFVIFATRPEVVPEPYITYLKNRIREDLGFEQIPIQLEMKASRSKWENREK
ncbi:MAG: ribosome biogenesis GTPase Der [Treponema sp.]|nr:ribosome biogenesis GTPase Der [Treponema sp.]